ncbi:hypothetical protein FNV43_RR04738 [Rhamnella rubrinervis]|uniref:Uncharacterized protein n=1 Tax=Rhamnella rubrinervis TaxID=2594499 RepID=A0A8K0HK32_9ROSA|nr:hypothetical protein FNV43_RR04738 [Rhamnella rubrinervis]
MAFFRNYSNETVSRSVLEEKGQRQSVNRFHNSVGNEDVDLTSSEKEFDMNVDVRDQSEGEPDYANRLQNEEAANDSVEVRVSNMQPSGRRTAMTGKWGSTFWKDCQPMQSHGGSESGQDSDCRNVVGSEYNSSDGKEERLQSKPAAVSIVRTSRVLNDSEDFDGGDDEDNNDDADYEEDDGDEDDPDDADFEPDYAVTSGRAVNKDKDWDVEDSEEDDASEEELDPSDEDDSYYEKKPKVSRRGKGGHSVKSTKEHKFYHGTGRPRREIIF